MNIRQPVDYAKLSIVMLLFVNPGKCCNYYDVSIHHMLKSELKDTILSSFFAVFMKDCWL